MSDEIKNIVEERILLLRIRYAGNETPESKTYLDYLNQRLLELNPRISVDQLQEIEKLIAEFRPTRTLI